MNDETPKALRYAESLLLLQSKPTQRLEEEIRLRQEDPRRSRFFFNDDIGFMAVKCGTCGGNGLTVASAEAFKDLEFVKADHLCEVCGGTGGGKTPEGNRICIRTEGQAFCHNEEVDVDGLIEFGEAPFEIITFDEYFKKVSTLKTGLEDFDEAMRFALAVDDACKEGKKHKEKKGKKT